MIRPFTCVCLLMAAGSGLYLYQTKHQTQMVDRDIERTLKLADAAWQRSGVLRAEYTLLNDPSRLADLSAQYLPTLQTTAPGQFSTWSDLDRRLPAVGPPPTDPALPDATTVTASLQSDAVAPEPPKAEPTRVEPVRAEQPRPEPPRPESPRVEPARAEPAHVDPPRSAIVALPSRPAPARPAPVVAAAEAMQPRPLAAASARMPPPASTVARSVLMPVLIAPPSVTNVASIRPQSAPPVFASDAVSRITRTGPVEPPSPMVGSALGMARTIASPAPAYTNSVGSLR